MAGEGEQAARYTDAITVELIAAVEAGAASVGAEREVDVGPDGPLDAVRQQLAADARRRRCASASPAVSATASTSTTPSPSSARGIYREWKTQRIDEHLDDLFRLAYCHGAVRTRLEPGRAVAWVVDPAGPPSPDCEDNALAGAVTSGDAFPSGHLSPPMHPGCRCLLVPVRPLAFRPVRPPSDLPRRRGGRRISGRVILILVGVLFLVVVVLGRALARFYVDYLWHDGLGRSDVFWGVIRAKATLFGMFFLTFALLAGINLVIADRLSPTRFPANAHPFVERFHEVFGHRLRLLRYGGALLLAVLVALPTTSEWQSWLLFRNSRSFDIADGQFHADVGFYVFELPFLGFVLDWLFIALILVLLLTVLTHVLNGGVVFASPDAVGAPGDQGPHRRAAGRAGGAQGR